LIHFEDSSKDSKKERKRISFSFSCKNAYVELLSQFGLMGPIGIGSVQQVLFEGKYTSNCLVSKDTKENELHTSGELLGPLNVK
jgi:hypothetical protein